MEIDIFKRSFQRFDVVLTGGASKTKQVTGMMIDLVGCPVLLFAHPVGRCWRLSSVETGGEFYTGDDGDNLDTVLSLAEVEAKEKKPHEWRSAIDKGKQALISLGLDYPLNTHFKTK